MALTSSIFGNTLGGGFFGQVSAKFTSATTASSWAPITNTALNANWLTPQQLVAQSPTAGGASGSFHQPIHGKTIPVFLGAIRRTTDIIWVNGPEELSSGVVQADFAVAIGRNEWQRPGTLLTVRMDDKLVYDARRGQVGPTSFTMRVYDGIDNDFDPLILSIEGADTTIAYHGLIYLVFESFNCDAFDRRIPVCTAEWTDTADESGGLYTPGDLTITEILTKLSTYDGLLTVDQVETEGLDGLTTRGVYLDRDNDLRNLVEDICALYGIDKVETGTGVLFRKTATDDLFLPDVEVAEADLIETKAGDISSIIQSRRKSETEIPYEVEVKYIDVNNDYNISPAKASRPTGVFQSTQSTLRRSLSVPFVDTSAKMTRLVTSALYRQVTAQTVHNYAVSRQHVAIEPGDVVQVTADGFVRILKTLRTVKRGDNTQEIVAEEYLTAVDTTIGVPTTIVQGVPVAGSSLDDWFADDGATAPWYGYAVWPPALYDAGSDKTFIAREAWDGAQRVIRVRGIDHATGYGFDLGTVGVVPLTDDDHGNPAIALDHEGHLHVFYGSHGLVAGSDARHSSTRWSVAGTAGAGSLWAVRDSFGSGYTYPKPVVIGSDIYLFFRKSDGSNSAKFVLFKTTALADGIPTWGSEQTIIDFGGTNIFYAGNFVISGTDIYFPATLADDGDTIREHVYLFVYDTLTGAVKNHDASASVASGSLPVDLTESNADYRLFEHTAGNGGNMPALCFDSSGDPHIVFTDGAGSSYALKHIKRTSGTWSSPETIATLDARRSNVALVPLASGVVEAWYAKDPGSLWVRGGNITRRERSAAGAWGLAHTVLTAGPAALGRPSMVLNGHADARVVFTEEAEDSLDTSAGGLRTYVYGAGGLVPYVEAPAVPPQATGNLLLGAEQLTLGAEDLIIDTTD